jgi:type II secretory pathway component PulM
MRWAEIALFLAPFILYAAWRVAAARAQPSVVWGTVAVLTVVIVATVWAGLANRLGRGETYVPAHWEHGEIVPGTGTRPTVP